MRCGADNGVFSPAKSLENISIKDIWNAVRGAEETTYLNPEKLESIDAVDELLNNADKAVIECFADTSLLDIINKQHILTP